MNRHSSAPFDHIINKLKQHQKSLEDATKAFTGDQFTGALTDIMYEQNKEDEKQGVVNKMKCKVTLTKQGDVIFRFEDKEVNGRKFFDSIKKKDK